MSQVVAFAESAEVNAKGLAESATMAALRSVPVLNRLVPDLTVAAPPAKLALGAHDAPPFCSSSFVIQLTAKIGVA